MGPIKVTYGVKRYRRRHVPSLTIFVIATFVTAICCAEQTASAAAEIDGLLNRLETSHCEFYRNGTWYQAEQARKHLQTKLRAAGKVETAEQFIDQIASRSSLTGRPYLVRCGESDPVESRLWLLAQLQSVRGE